MCYNNIVEICRVFDSDFDVVVSVDEEIIWWIEQNIEKGKWQVSYSLTVGGLTSVYLFKDAEDALAFKLRWE